jgi:uncharacterized DUF497 family protein
MDVRVIWDMEDDPEGNVQHILEHGIDLDDVEEVLLNRNNEVVPSRSSKNSVVFGYTSAGRYIAVVFEVIDDEPITIYPVTAYEVPEPRTR